MNRVKYPGITLAVIILLLLIIPQMAYASIDGGALAQATYPYYIDPGTGSIIIQALIGVLVAGAAMIGIYRARVKMFFGNLFTGRRAEKKGGETEESE